MRRLVPFLLLLTGLVSGPALHPPAALAQGQTPPGFTPFSRPQFGAGLKQEPIQKNEPVTFTADRITYDRTRNLVIATGHVEAWQNDHVLRADRVVFDQNTNVAQASGHVVLLEPDGEVLFADYAELSQGMRQVVMRNMGAQLADNARLAATGARHTDGNATELSRVVYSACDLCRSDPTAPPSWQILANSAVDDKTLQRMEFQDATVELFGVPLFYAPYFSTPDSQVKRQSGFLAPDAGVNSFIGTFFALPYYYVIDNSSDLTITPWIDSGEDPQLQLLYRQRFNDGYMKLNTAVAYDENAMQGYFFGQGDFDWDANWRYGFNINEASSANYMRDFFISGYGNDVLSSTTYIEGFGQGAYSRLDTQFYQGLLDIVNDKELPYVMPRYLYDYVGTPDDLGGYFTFNGGGFNVLRFVGTNTQRINGTLSYNLPTFGPWGQEWTFLARLYSAAYEANALNQIPNFSSYNQATTAQLWPAFAARLNWPFARLDGNATTIIEPIVQVVLRPNGDGLVPVAEIPNEDSIDQLFTDANLFSINRLPGIDRLGGGQRADVGLHVSWLEGSQTLDALIGQSYRSQTEYQLWGPGTGLGGNVSDIVGRIFYQPADFLDVTERFRLNHDTYATEFDDLVLNFGPPTFRVNVGYIYSNLDPFYFYNQPAFYPIPPGAPYQALDFPRNELSLGLETRFGNWRFGGYVQRNMQLNQMVAYGLHGGYENDCLMLAFNYFDVFTNYNGVSNVQALTVSLTFKTIGQFGAPML